MKFTGNLGERYVTVEASQRLLEVTDLKVHSRYSFYIKATNAAGTA
jgi:hypothetical protein